MKKINGLQYWFIFEIIYLFLKQSSYFKYCLRFLSKMEVMAKKNVTTSVWAPPHGEMGSPWGPN